MKNQTTYLIYLLIISIIFSCNNDDNINTTTGIAIDFTENIEAYNGELLEESYVLAIENGANASYLLDKRGNKVKEWLFEDNLGNDLELLPNGKLIGIFKVDNPFFSFGGFGGKLKILNSDGSTDWEFEYASDIVLAHHDLELLPNGNILFLAWEKIPALVGQSEGVAEGIDIYPEVILEINLDTNEIVWEWHSFDHIIQDQSPTTNNFGVLNENPQLVDINYNIYPESNGDIMHANGLDYDPIKDVIYLSVNFYSEVWVIDHSTTTEQAASHTGGNYNKGGDLIYRFGNPEAYNNVGVRLFDNNHFPNFLQEDEIGAGNILIYDNGTTSNQSTVYELSMPEVFNLTSGVNNEPEIIWSFTDENLFNPRISGAVRLKNGNTLIAEGDYGFWEVTENDEVVWKYNGFGTNFWRCYAYNVDDQEIIDLDL